MNSIRLCYTVGNPTQGWGKLVWGIFYRVQGGGGIYYYYGGLDPGLRKPTDPCLFCTPGEIIH